MDWYSYLHEKRQEIKYWDWSKQFGNWFVDQLYYLLIVKSVILYWSKEI